MRERNVMEKVLRRVTKSPVRRREGTIKKSKFIFFLFTVPTLLLYSIFFIFPMILGVYYSMTDWNGISKKYSFIGLSNFQRLFGDARLRSSLAFNFKYVLILIICINSIALILALLLNSKIKLRTLARSVFFLPAVLSLVTVGLIWNEIFYRVIPKIGEILSWPLLESNILSSSKTAIYGVLLVHIWQGLAIPTVLFLAGLQSIPSDLYEAATIDGANSFNKFKSITIPFLIPILNINLITTIKSGLTVFDYIKVMTDGGPGRATEAIGILIYNHAFVEMKFSYAVAESLLLFVIIGAISIMQFKFFNKREVGEQ
jgi:raffinose/stachyose/melibiose transport system permease protein